MDPAARRKLWEVICEVSSNRSIILTTHSMEECEAICNRVAVMVSGEIKCLGSPQHLKSRFGGDYQIDMCCRHASEELIVQIASNIQSCCRNVSVVLEEIHGAHCRLKLCCERIFEDEKMISSIDLEKVFQFLEDSKNAARIVTYTVSQSSLEQIFLDFAKLQNEESSNVSHIKHIPSLN